MKNILIISIEILLIIMINSCIKEKPSTPAVNTTEVTNITQTTATSGGVVINDGGAPVTARGVCWSISPEPTIVNSKTTENGGINLFISNITQLTPYTTYYVRAYATNSAGTGYGNNVLFTSKSISGPTVTTSEISSITTTSAVSGGNIFSDGGASVIERGVCWGTDPVPTINNNKIIDGIGTGSFTMNMTGLITNTKYYVRAYAINSAWTSYGELQSFTTLAYTTVGQIEDIDNDIYTAIAIGNQIWMKENLKVTHYNNGDPIPNIIDDNEWWNLTSGAYCDYDNNPINSITYGRLYNWYAATDDRNLCPSGWHLPSDSEWMTLINYLGGESIAGGKLKEEGTLHWFGPNTGAINSSGFTALPAGGRQKASLNSVYFSEYSALGVYVNYWTNTEYNSSFAYTWALGFMQNNVWQTPDWKFWSFPIRCIKDN